MNKTANLDVLLIHMPFGIHLLPSLGLSLLKAGVQKKGFSVNIKYYSLKFTKMIGNRIYEIVSSGAPVYHYLFGEWIFACTLFDNLLPEQDYIDQILNSEEDDYPKYNSGTVLNYKRELIPLIPELKAIAENFIDSCLNEVISMKPKVVGFSSCFQQNVASLSLAKRIKQILPETIIVFGGANCEGEMGIEIVKKFSFVDIVVSGEADEVFPELIGRINNREDYSQLQGVICRKNLDRYTDGMVNPPMVKDMDSLPIPDYDDFFQEIKNYGLEEVEPPILLFESSRGCWWGEKSHCTFCGLNGNNMLHRSKSASRALSEIRFLKEKYKINRLVVTDNILDLSYFKDFIPALAQANLHLGLFYEVKANLTKDQLRLLKAAKILSLQPGVESFSTHVLDLMKKGVKSIQNVQLLKWCKELGINPIWNLLWGFPGETKEDYYEMAKLFPKITHLGLPRGASKLRLDRFSPNFNFPEKFGIKTISPFPSYNYIYPFEKESLRKLAYFYNYEYNPAEKFAYALENMMHELERWKANHHQMDLFFVDKDNSLIIFDLRLIAEKPYYIFRDKERFIYLLCDKIQPLSKIKKEYSLYFNYDVNETEIETILNSLIEKNLLIRENNSFLSLAIAFGDYKPPQHIMAKLMMILKSQPEGDNEVTVTNNRLLITLRP